MSGGEFPDEVAALPTAAISDAMDALGVTGTLPGIAPLASGQRMLGRAYTVRYVAAGTPPGTVGDYIDDVPAGSVVVLDNGGRTDCTVWGDILTAVAASRGIAGTVIDGVCRDTHRARTTGYPVYSRGFFMRTGKDRVELSDVQRPVSIAGVQVRPGDLLAGDDDGVLAVPAGRVGDVLAKALEIERVEAGILAEALAHGSLREARARLGYHALQTPER